MHAHHRMRAKTHTDMHAHKQHSPRAEPNLPQAPCPHGSQRLTAPSPSELAEQGLHGGAADWPWRHVGTGLPGDGARAEVAAGRARAFARCDSAAGGAARAPSARLGRMGHTGWASLRVVVVHLTQSLHRAGPVRAGWARPPVSSRAGQAVRRLHALLRDESSASRSPGQPRAATRSLVTSPLPPADCPGGLMGSRPAGRSKAG